jgi:dipeptidyl-peptidase-4
MNTPVPLCAVRFIPFLTVLLAHFVSSLVQADDLKPVSSTPISRVLWHPAGKQVTYVKRIVKGNRSNDALWGYDVDAASERLLIDPEDAAPGKQTTRPAWSLAGYQWSPDGKALLVTGEHDLWLVPTTGEEPRRLTHDEASEESPTFSPDGSHVAFVKRNDLHVVDLRTGASTQLTRDGSDTILNGTLDWVYGEELGHLTGTNRSYEWSPDGRRIVCLRLDQASVPEHSRP